MKRKINNIEVNKFVSASTKIRKLNFQEFTAKQSAISLQTEQKISVGEASGAWGRIHHSHSRALVNGVCYCTRCGQFAIKKVEGLASVCTGRPLNSYGRAQLKKLNGGKHPVRGALTWPDGTHSAVVFKPRRLDIL